MTQGVCCRRVQLCDTRAAIQRTVSGEDRAHFVFSDILGEALARLLRSNPATVSNHANPDHADSIGPLQET